MRRSSSLLLLGVTSISSVVAADAVAIPFGGVEFPLGAVSFADKVVSAQLGPLTIPPYDDPLTTIGIPDYVPKPIGQPDNTLALGNGGSIVLEFVDNRLIDQDAVEYGRDLFIFEAGGAVESFSVEISKDGNSYLSVGTLVGQPTGVDIKPFISPGDVFRFVRITDANAGRSGSPFAGADIDAVGAIGSIVPEPMAVQTAAALAVVLVSCGVGQRGRKRQKIGA